MQCYKWRYTHKHYVRVHIPFSSHIFHYYCKYWIFIEHTSLLSQLKMSSHVHSSVPVMVSYTNIILGHHLIAVFDHVKWLEGICLSKLLAMICSYLFSFGLIVSFFHDYSSLPYHWPTDSPTLHNHFLPFNSLDFHLSFSLTCMYFFTIPSHSFTFYCFVICSGTLQVSDI